MGTWLSSSSVGKTRSGPTATRAVMRSSQRRTSSSRASRSAAARMAAGPPARRPPPRGDSAALLLLLAVLGRSRVRVHRRTLSAGSAPRRAVSVARQGHRKDGAASDGAFHRDLASQQLYEPPHDAEAQTGATIGAPATRGVDLPEW